MKQAQSFLRMKNDKHLQNHNDIRIKLDDLRQPSTRSDE